MAPGPRPSRSASSLAREGLCTVEHHAGEPGQGCGREDRLPPGSVARASRTRSRSTGTVSTPWSASLASWRSRGPSRMALVLGCPVYDDPCTAGRYAARLVTRFCELHRGAGPDHPATRCAAFASIRSKRHWRANTRGDRMNFDIEIPVRMVWNGVKVINEPVPVRYLTADRRRHLPLPDVLGHGAHQLDAHQAGSNNT